MNGSSPILVVLFLLASTSCYAAKITDRLSLTEAIDSVRQDGVEITYSNKLVKPWMRVRETPSAEDPVAALREALAAYNLILQRGPQHQWLVVKGEVVEPLSPAIPASIQRSPPPKIESIFDLDEIVIVASRYSLFSQEAVRDQFLTGDEIRLLPHIADDAFRAFHRVPGAAATDFSAPFHLRGGATNELMVELDGVELIEPFHMQTLFSPLSIIDPGIIENAAILSGGFTANHGNYASGVVEITSNLTHTEPVHELGVSFVSAFARSSGAWGDKGAYLVSARRGYLDLLADAVAIGDEDITPRYGDLFAKAGYAISDNTDIEANLLFASDRVTYEDESEGELGEGESSQYYFWVTIDTEPSDRVRWKNTLSVGQVDAEDTGQLRNLPHETMDRYYRRDYNVAGLQSELSLHVTDSQLWMMGVQYRSLEAGYDYKINSVRWFDYFNNGQPLVLQRDIVTSSDGSNYGAFLRYRYQPTARSMWELGLRWDRQNYSNTEDDTQLSPRANVLFQLGDRTDLRFGWGYFYQPQGIHELQVEDGVTEYFPAEQAEHFVTGIRHRFESDVELQMDVYLKNYSDLRPRYENVLDRFEYAPESDFDRVLVEPSSAEANGVEITLRNRQGDSVDWWLNYTWSRVEDVIDGVSVPRSWDQRHAVTGNLTWRGERWMLSLVGRYHSGWPRTRLLLTPDYEGDLSQRNESRYEDYFRLDLRLSRTVDLRRGSFQYYFEIFNLLDNDNQCCVAGHDLTVGSTPIVSPYFDNYLPFFPSFGFVWTFGAGS